MADAVYRRRGIIAPGTTRTTARQWRHRYRLALIPSALASAPSSLGPQHCRSRRPWPCKPSRPPSGRLALPHLGQWLGLSSPTLGVLSFQLLTLTLIRMIAEWLRGELDNDRYGARREGLTSRHLHTRPTHCRCPPSPHRFYIMEFHKGRASSVMAGEENSPQTEGSEKGLKPSTSPRRNSEDGGRSHRNRLL
jgi:hypothetical protein